MFSQHRFELRVGDFVPQRFAFDFVGINVSGTRNMTEQIELRCPPGRFNDFPVTGRFGGDGFALLQVV
ncbi:hypothetical protein D3C73_1474440 [compost metagenome]